MDQISYKGYAQRTEFDPIKAPDQTARIFQEGNRVIRGMEAVRDQERRNREQYLQGLQRKNALEAQNRQSNKNLNDQFRETYQKAVLQNYKTKVDDAYREVQNQERIAKSISSLSTTATQLVSDFAQRRAQAEELAGRNAVFESGVSYQEAMQLRAGEAKLDAADTAYTKLATDLQARGVSMEQISSIRKLSGRRWYGAMQAWALDGAEQYATFRAENVDREFDINGTPYTINTAQNAGPEVWAAINAQLRNEYLKQYSGIDNKFLDKYLFPGMRETEAQERTAFANARSKALTLEFQDQQRSELFNDWRAAKNEGNGAQGFWSWVQRTSGGTKVGLRNQRLAGISYLKEAIDNGEFTSADVEELASLEITLTGSTKPQKFGDLYKSEVGQLRKAAQDFTVGKFRDEQMNVEMATQEWKSQLYDTISQSGPPNKAEVRALISSFESQFKQPAPGWLTSMETVEELQDEAGEEILKQLVADNRLTLSYLNSGKFSTNLRLKYREAAVSQQRISKEDSQRAKQAADGALKESLQSLASANQGSMFYLMQGYAHRDVEQRAQKYITEGAQSFEAYQKAGQEVVTEIKRGDKGEGLYARKLDPNSGRPIVGDGGGFTALGTDSGQLAQRKRAGEIRDAVLKNRSNSDFLRSTLVLTPTELAQVEAVSRGGAIPPAIYILDNLYPNLDPYQIMDLQLQKAGKPPITRPPEAQVYGYVRPELSRLLTNRPSLSRTARATYLTAGGSQPYAPILDLIASKESQGTDRKYRGYDALNRGGSAGGHVAHGSGTGTGAFGRPLTQMTVGQIMDMQARGELHATGRYQIIGSTLRSLIQRGVASRNDLYDEATQDKLAISLLHGRAGKFFAGSANAEQVIPGLGQEWIGLQDLPADRVKQALVQAKANLANPRFDTANMREEIVYKVSGIGPTSTGPHLDVKDTTGKFFARASLDNFIAFRTAQGLKPLSSGVTVRGGEFGAARAYGQHLGWDYAVPDGTPVVLRNGARVIAKRATEHGDQLTIALPDGRRFNFLHGKAL